MFIAGTVKPETSPRPRAMYRSWMEAGRMPSACADLADDPARGVADVVARRRGRRRAGERRRCRASRSACSSTISTGSRRPTRTASFRRGRGGRAPARAPGSPDRRWWRRGSLPWSVVSLVRMGCGSSRRPRVRWEDAAARGGEASERRRRARWSAACTARRHERHARTLLSGAALGAGALAAYAFLVEPRWLELTRPADPPPRAARRRWRG